MPFCAFWVQDFDDFFAIGHAGGRGCVELNVSFDEFDGAVGASGYGLRRAPVNNKSSAPPVIRRARKAREGAESFSTLTVRRG